LPWPRVTATIRPVIEAITICGAAFAASGLTLFAGFGLGTLLMPVVALFFPVDVAIAITALVHLANNVFKLGLLGRQADRYVLVRFGVPAVVAALAGAWLLTVLAASPPLFSWEAFGRRQDVSLLKLVVGVLILVFVLVEQSPALARLSIDRRYLPWGGVLSGFFGGLSGHQGAFRSMFLLKSGLSKEAFVATGAVLAVLVDVVRTVVYGWDYAGRAAPVDWGLVGAASLAAFAGAWLGARWLRKVTIRTVQLAVSVLLVVVGLGLVLGLL
jgi:uncharacterized membrane protein YfcA